jgi:PST family polysaccharide transporter
VTSQTSPTAASAGDDPDEVGPDGRPLTGDDPTHTGEMSTAAIAQGAKRGLVWSLLGTIVLKLGSFAMALVLARLLEPEHFGAYAVALAATHFAMNVNDIGLISATVQWRGRLEEMAPTGATLALGFSVLLYGVFWFGADEFARLAGDPAAAGVVRVLTFTILIDGVTAVSAGALMRRFQQDKLTQANGAGFVVTAAVTIGLAATGAGAYSFAWGQVCGAVVTGALFIYWSKLPRRYGFDRAVAKRLLVFGVPLAASLGVEAVVMNADYIIVGNALGAVALGFYLMAFNISSWVPGIVSTAVRYVSVAGFARLSEKESGVLSAGVERSVPLLMTLLVPVAVLMGVLAGPIVTVLFGLTWLPAASVLQLLMILTVVRMLTAFGFDILAGAGAARAALWVNLGWVVALLPALWLGAHLDGIHGAAAAHVIVGLLVALPLTALALHRIGVRLGAVGRGLLRPLAGGGAAFVVCLLLAQIPAGSLVRLLVAGFGGAIAFALVGIRPADRKMALGKLRELRRRGEVTADA